MLPHRYDAPESAMYSYTEQTLPAVPQCQWMQQLPEVVVRAAVVVANIATQSAGQNAARMFYYNCLSENGWRSNYFNEVVDLAVGMSVVMATQNVVQHPMQAIDRCAGDAVTLLLSKYILEFRELGSLCSQEQVAGAGQNMGSLNDQYMRIAQLRQAPAQQAYPQGAYPQGYPQAGAYPNSGAYSSAIPVPGGRPAYPAPQGNLAYGGYPSGGAYQGSSNVSLGSGSGQPDDRYAQRGAPNDRFAQSAAVTRPVPGPVEPSLSQAAYYTPRGTNTTTAPQSAGPVSPAQTSTEYSVKNWRPSPKQYYRAAYSLDEYEATYTKFGDIIIENLNPIGEEEMDRRAHTLVLGSTPVVARQEVITRLTSESAEMKKAIDDVRMGASEETELKVAEYVWPKILLSSWLEDLIFSGKQHQRDVQKEQAENSVFRCFAVLTKPYATPLDFNELIFKEAGVTKFKTFLEVKELIIDINRKARVLAQEEGSISQSLIAFGVELNRRMTKMLNAFLKYNLSLESVELDDFIEDIADLRDYLKKSFSSAYAEALDRYEYDTVPELFKTQLQGFETEQRMNLVEIGKDGEVDGADNVTFLSAAYSLTYLDALSSELNLNVGKEGLLIKESISPVLFNAAKSLFCKKEWLGIIPTEHLLITSDNVIYQLRKGYMGHESYLISLV